MLEAYFDGYLGQIDRLFAKDMLAGAGEGLDQIGMGVGGRTDQHAVDAGGGYAVMAGGLARVASVANTRIISMQRGGASKDTWVLTNGPVSDFSLLKPSVGVRDLVRAGANLSSRVVENLFWLGRYSERFDDSARMLRVALGRVVVAGGGKTPAVIAAMALARHVGVLPEPGEDDPVKEGSEHVLLEAIYNPEQPGSLAGNIRSLMWAATHVRERLSLDHWHSLNRLQRDQQAALKKHPTLTEAIAFLDRVLGVSSSLTGFAMDNMTRDDGWRLLSIGRHLERLGFLADALARAIETGAVFEAGGFEAVVALFDSTITFHAQYQQRRDMPALLDLLVIDRDNPRSLAWVAQTLRGRIAKIEAAAGTPGESAATGIPEASELSLAALCALDAEGRHAALEDYLGRCVRGVTGLSDVLATRYFTHSIDALRHSVGA